MNRPPITSGGCCWWTRSIPTRRRSRSTAGYEPDEGGHYYTSAGLLLGLLVDCLAADLAMPGDLRSHIGLTCETDGFQKAAWGQYAAQWSYPDDGLNISIWITNPESLPLETVPR